MAKCYSKELRDRVLSYVDKHGDKSEAARIFQVCRATVYVWLSQRSQGQVEGRRAGRKGGHGKVDVAALAAYVEAHDDHTLKVIGAHFGVSDVAILKRLRQIDITHKKNLSVHRAGRKG